MARQAPNHIAANRLPVPDSGSLDEEKGGVFCAVPLISSGVPAKQKTALTRFLGAAQVSLGSWNAKERGCHGGRPR